VQRQIEIHADSHVLHRSPAEDALEGVLHGFLPADLFAPGLARERDRQRARGARRGQSPECPQYPPATDRWTAAHTLPPPPPGESRWLPGRIYRTRHAASEVRYGAGREAMLAVYI